MGYIFYDMCLNLVFGVFVIVDSWSVYVQNEKKIEFYWECIVKGELLLIKGYMLDKDEQIICCYIFNIMCKESICWLYLVV